jgi:hypothetical protein
MARPHLESVQLIQVLTDWTAEQFPISVMYPQSRHLSTKVRIFVDWVSELIQQDPIFQTPLELASQMSRYPVTRSLYFDCACHT